MCFQQDGRVRLVERLRPRKDSFIICHSLGIYANALVFRKVVACLVTGQIADWIGRRYTLLIALVIAFIAIAIEFIATTNAVFFTGKLIQGFSIGIIATMMVGYVGEIAPLKLRGILTCFLGVSYGIGPLVAFIIINYTGNVETRWAYRTIFCSQWGFAAVATIIWPWMPE
jgi:SP family general alpha glucoside:H+ symporter-like MFS transporter